MSLSRLTLAALDLPRLQQLLSDGLSEGPDVEFKLELATERPIQFLKEITAFANTRGGDLLVGVTDDGEAIGILSEEVREQIDRVQSALDSSVDPPVQGVQYHTVRLTDERSVLVIRVPFSLLGPHMITSDKQSRFYRRSEASSVPMGLDDLRTSFLYGANFAAAIEGWRAERLAAINRGGSIPRPRLFVHVFPFSAMDRRVHIDIDLLTEGRDGLAVFLGPPNTPRILLEGIARGNSADWNQSSTLLSRSGWIESHVRLFTVKEQDQEIGVFDTAWFRQVVEAIQRHLVRLKSLNLAPPIAVGISLHDVRGSMLRAGERMIGRASQDLDAIIPFTVLETWPRDLSGVLWPSFDHLMGTFGLSNAVEWRFTASYGIDAE